MKISENVSYKYDHYYKYEEVTNILKKWEKENEKYACLKSIGKSGEGRDIWLMEITNKETGDFDFKPAYYVEANIHAGEITGTMTAMYFLDTIFTNIESKEIQDLIKKITIYVVPRVSPDGSEYYLTTPYSVRSVNRVFPYSEELEGLEPCDIDGDGVIRKMRVKSPYGIWKVSDKDPRIMSRRKPDDVEGEFYNIYSEGLIKNFDGVNINTLNKFGNDFNRNYPYEWKAHGTQRGSGLYPLSNPETKANADFLLNHRNVCFVVDLHTSGGMNLYTPGCKPSRDANQKDISIYRTIGEMAKEENGYPLLNVYDEFGNGAEDVTYGGFDDFCHFVVGVPAYTIELWNHAERAGIKNTFPPKHKTDSEQEEEAYKYAKWIDEKFENPDMYFKPWTKFNHPQLGEVEIGGIDIKFAIQNPPANLLYEELAKHTNFFLRAMKTLPDVEINKVDIKAISDNLYKLDLTIINKGYMPSYVFTEGLKNSNLAPLTITISNCDIIEGKETEKIGSLEGYSAIFGMNGGYGPMSFGANSCAKKISWVIKANKGDTISFTVKGERIGIIEKSITL